MLIDVFVPYSIMALIGAVITSLTNSMLPDSLLPASQFEAHFSVSIMDRHSERKLMDIRGKDRWMDFFSLSLLSLSFFFVKAVLECHVITQAMHAQQGYSPGEVHCGSVSGAA